MAGVANQIHESHNQDKSSSVSFHVYHRRISPRTVYNLPEELVIEILKRLPVTSLLRFMCVCKSWYSLITNPSFISVHLSHQSNPTSKNCSTTLYSFGFQFFLHNVDEPLDNWAKIDYLVGYSKSLIVGNFDGVICLVDDWHHFVGPLILWNPSIRKAFTLPLPIPPLRALKLTLVGPIFPRLIICGFGFGFDPISKDYKVVRVLYNWDVERQITYFHADVCSLSLGDWRAVGSSVEGGRFVIDRRGVCVNGVIHWMCRNRLNFTVKTVLTFNLANECFGQIVLPDPLSSAVLLSVKLVEDKLAVSCTGDGSNVWVMEEYGIAKSWRKLLDFHLGEDVGTVLGAAVGRDGKIVVTTSVGNSISWDPTNQKLKNVALPILKPDYVDTYVRSLVLLGFKNQALHCRNLPLEKSITAPNFR